MAVFANVRTRTYPYRFTLSATAQDGAVVNTDPARPSFAAASPEAAKNDALPTARVEDDVLVDVVLPVRGSYAPNQYPEVTILTERPSPDDPKKLASVTLVDKARYPQFRALYRYNFNTGVFASRVQPSTFQKVRTVPDDPATKDVDESRYRIEEVHGATTVTPVFGFTYYPKPVDIQSPVSFERYIPAPTIAFAFSNPANNLFFGFSHEILRNAQLVWGWQWGVVKQRLNRDDVTEDANGTDPPTIERRDVAFSFGLTFNIVAISKIFK